ncbi:MAG: lysophospholipid acyltransferase family protein [Bacilli bacterium]|jgi:1-acyl-sn-glycerol-3-phosphate acyltransferase
MFKYLCVILKVGYYIIWCYFSFMRKYAKHPEKYPLNERWRRYQKLVRKILWAFNVRLEVKNLHLIQTRAPQFIVGNHLSMMDPLILIAISQKPLVFVAKKETAKFPFIGKALMGLDGLFLERRALKQEVKIMLQVRAFIAEEKRTVVMFPEGTRSKSFHLPVATFKPGSFKYALETETPIVPFASVGQQFILSGKLNWKSHPVFVKFANPITFKKGEIDTIKASAYFRDQVQTLVDETKEKYLLTMENLPLKKFSRWALNE